MITSNVGTFNEENKLYTSKSCIAQISTLEESSNCSRKISEKRTKIRRHKSFADICYGIARVLPSLWFFDERWKAVVEVVWM